MKLMIFAVLGLLLGVGGGSAMTVLKARKGFATFGAQRARVVADSIEIATNHGVTPDGAAHDSSLAATDSATVAPDSSHATVANAPSAAKTKEAAPAPAPTTTRHETSKPASSKESASGNSETTRPRALATVEAHGGTRPGAAVLPSRPVPGMKADTPSTGTVKLGKIFGAMPAKDAAKVLEQLNDTEVHEILSTLPAKVAGGIMQHLPATRAAAVSKLAMKGGAE